MQRRWLSYKSILIVIIAGLFESCDDIFPLPSGPVNIGWIPVYEVPDSLYALRRTSRRDASQNRLFFFDPLDSSQFVVIDSFRYRLDTLRGIAIQNTSSNIVSSVADYYYRVPGIRSLRVENDSLIVNNLSDEVTLFTGDSPRLSVSSRRFDAAAPFIFPEQKPDPTSLGDPNTARHSYFVCPDSTKGVLLGWRFEITAEADCYVFDQ